MRTAEVSGDQTARSPLNRLPRAPIDALANPLARFLRIETASGAILLLAAALALALSNSPWAERFRSLWMTQIGIQIGPFRLVRASREWINDGLMTLFFFVVALELKRELVLGELRNPRVAALSIAAAVGGMLVPVGRRGAAGRHRFHHGTVHRRPGVPGRAARPGQAGHPGCLDRVCGCRPPAAGLAVATRAPRPHGQCRAPAVERSHAGRSGAARPAGSDTPAGAGREPVRAGGVKVAPAA